MNDVIGRLDLLHLREDREGYVLYRVCGTVPRLGKTAYLEAIYSREMIKDMGDERFRELASDELAGWVRSQPEWKALPP